MRALEFVGLFFSKLLPGNAHNGHWMGSLVILPKKKKKKKKKTWRAILEWRDNHSRDLKDPSEGDYIFLK